MFNAPMQSFCDFEYAVECRLRDTIVRVRTAFKFVESEIGHFVAPMSVVPTVTLLSITDEPAPPLGSILRPWRVCNPLLAVFRLHPLKRDS